MVTRVSSNVLAVIEAWITAEKMLIDREKMPVLPFRKSRGHSGFLP
jgi:hypothetical protein